MEQLRYLGGKEIIHFRNRVEFEQSAQRIVGQTITEWLDSRISKIGRLGEQNIQAQQVESDVRAQRQHRIQGNRKNRPIVIKSRQSRTRRREKEVKAKSKKGES